MKFKGILPVICAILTALAVVPAGCSGNRSVILEAEKAVAQPAYDSACAIERRANSRSEYITSNGKYIGNLQKGNTVSWFFTAERSGSCNFKLFAANAEDGSASFTAGAGKVFSVTLNGNEIILPEYKIAAGTKYGDFWQSLAFSGKISEGVNILTYTALSDTLKLNVDCLSLDCAFPVAEHQHMWRVTGAPSDCVNGGNAVSDCADCGYSYVTEVLNPLGHNYGNYHYDSLSGKMVTRCVRCGDINTADAPSSRYFGEVFFSKDGFSVRPKVTLYEAEHAYICTEGGLDNAGAKTCIKEDESFSGGKCVENLSKPGNYLRFTAVAQSAVKADLVFCMSNTMYSPNGIAELDPMSDYVYCTVNGESVDFSFVSFPGFDSASYFVWRYVVVKDVDLIDGVNEIEIGPKENDRNWITMPNADWLKICTDELDVQTVRYYDVNGVKRVENYAGYANSLAFDISGSPSLYAGKSADVADIVMELDSKSIIADLSEECEITYNYKTVNLEGIKLESGHNTVVVSGVTVNALYNGMAIKFRGGGITFKEITLRTPEFLPAASECEIKPEYDYVNNGGNDGAPKPAFVFEAEEADLGDSRSSREGVELVENNVYENTGRLASGNKTIGNFGLAGNKIVWRFTSDGQVEADVVLMVASANFSAAAGGNTLTEDLQEKIVVTVNGTAAKLDGITLTVNSVANYYDWKAITIRCTLNKGLNEVSIEALGYGAPNMDVMYIYAQGAQFGKA